MHIHKSVTQKVVDANHRNSDHSTGPRTAKGKNAVHHNALRHGLLARALVFKNDDERNSFRAYQKRIVDDLAPKGALELMMVEDLVNADWRLKRATRWEQNVWMDNDMTTIAAEALHSGTDKLGIVGEPDEENSRGLRCKELTFSLRSEDSKIDKTYSISNDPHGVELKAKLTDPRGDLETILRYQGAIRRDRDNAMDRLLKLQRSRAKADKEARRSSKR
jgi:hypothetical protein